MFNKKKLPIIEDDEELYSTSEEMEEVTTPKPKKEKKPREKVNISFFRSRFFAGILAVAFAIIMTFVVTPIMENIASTKITVVKTKEEIKKGTYITSDMVKMVEIGGYNQSTAITSTTDVVGRYAAIDIVSNDIITLDKLSNEIPYTNEYLYELASDKLAMSFSIQSLARGLTAKIRPGDVISIYAIYKDLDNAEGNENCYSDAVLRPELKYVEVLAISDELASDLADDTLEDLADLNEVEEEFLPATITVAVNDKQASVLAGIEAGASSHIALVCRNGNENKQKYLDLQTEFFAEPKADEEQEENLELDENSNTENKVTEETPNLNIEEEKNNGN